jgi:hypothetical protein
MAGAVRSQQHAIVSLLFGSMHQQRGVVVCSIGMAVISWQRAG